MKNYIKSLFVIIILTAFMTFNVLSQGCLPNGITFTTQFSINYPNCNEIEGSIIITGSNITNLSWLSSIQKIGGGLSINNTDSLINLIGLNLTDTIGYLYINNNTSLQNFNGLELLKYTNGIYRWVYEALGVLLLQAFNLLCRLLMFISFNLTTCRPMTYIHYVCFRALSCSQVYW